MKLFTETHETEHIFHVMGSGFSCQYDGILGQDFWRKYRATINYCDRTITMNDVTMNFDSETDRTKGKIYKLTLKPRIESIVRLPTKSKGLGIIPKKEIIPGVYLAESLTEEIDGHCITSMVNTLEKKIIIDPPHVQLEEIENECDDTVQIFSSSEVETDNRLSYELS